MPDNENFPYHRFSQYLREKLGRKTHKVSVDAGLGCPNLIEGNIETGCAWCDNSSFNAARELSGLSIEKQLEKGMAFLRRRNKVDCFIAYFQPHTNTYADTDTLRDLYSRALAVEGIRGIAIGTRPDCVSQEIIAMIAEVAAGKFVQIEYGLQTANDQTLRDMGRGHGSDAFVRAVEMTKETAPEIDVCAHMITGLPGEDDTDAHNTARMIVQSGANGIKLHNLHLVRGTRLARRYEEKPFRIATLEEHARLVADLLEEIPRRVNIQRLWGASAGREMHIAPDWCLDGPGALKAILAEFSRRGSYQGLRAKQD